MAFPVGRFIPLNPRDGVEMALPVAAACFSVGEKGWALLGSLRVGVG